MTRPPLHEIPLDIALPLRLGWLYATMSIGQWDLFLQIVYQRGWTLLELDQDEKPVRAFRREFQ